MPGDAIAAMQARLDAKPVNDESFEVWADCWDAVEFFRALRGQWNYVSGLSVVRVGLNFNSVESAMNLQRIRGRLRRRLFEDLKVMENAVLMADRAVAAKKKDKE